MGVMVLRSVALTKQEAAIAYALLHHAQTKKGHDILSADGLTVLNALVDKMKDLTDRLIEADKG